MASERDTARNSNLNCMLKSRVQTEFKIKPLLMLRRNSAEPQRYQRLLTLSPSTEININVLPHLKIIPLALPSCYYHIQRHAHKIDTVGP